jgi:single-strand DNA-binding protein
MSQGGYVTLVGFVAREPSLRTVMGNRQVADVRIGATNRIYDKGADQWRDLDTSYYTVTCWRRLASHVALSLRKGDPVVVKGRFRTHSYVDKQGTNRAEIEIVADTIGHDLSRGPANYVRPERPREQAGDVTADGGMDEGGRSSHDPEDPGEEGSMADAGTPPTAGPGSGLIDEGAVEDFGRKLSDDEAVARELGEPEPGVPLPF